MHISNVLAFGLLALAPIISGQDVASDAVARRHVGGGSVITRSVALDLEAREPHHKGKKVNLAARQEEANEELEDRSPEPRKKGKKGKKVKAAARQEEEANEELEIREPEHKAATAGKAAITITGTGATSLPAKPDGCATITPANSTAQTVCVKAVTAKGFNMSVKDVATGKKTSCTVAGTSGTCGTTGAGASVAAPAAPAAGKAAAGKAAITITGTGATSLPAKPDGCATITPANSTAQTVCVKAVTTKGFNMSVKDVATGKKTSCTVAGTSGTCGTTGAGASVSAVA
ncbi:hypothetical protein VE00_08512 [Pseudogymnoascus sp. WSF 3629]|nr:hypothetical protein VE00_08512 [Pseudogymnoascus sp. WSF 3629]